MIAPPDFVPASAVDKWEVHPGEITGVGYLPGVSEADVNAYNRAYSGRGANSDIVISDRLDAEMAEHNREARRKPTESRYNLRDFSVETGHPEELAAELAEWLEIVGRSEKIDSISTEKGKLVFGNPVVLPAYMPDIHHALADD